MGSDDLSVNGWTLATITPTLNCATTLHGTIRSVKALGGKVTHVVVDGGSTDNTVAIAAEAGSIVIPQRSMGGMYAAINDGVSNTNAPWVSYLNGDDLTLGQAYLELVAYGEASGADIVYGEGCRLMFTGDRVRCTLHAACSRPRSFLVRAAMPFSQPSAVFRRSVWEQLGGFASELVVTGDVDFYLRAYERGFRFRHARGVLASGFRVTAGSLGARNEVTYRRERARLWRRRQSLYTFPEFVVVRCLRALDSIRLRRRYSSASLVRQIAALVGAGP